MIPVDKSTTLLKTRIISNLVPHDRSKSYNRRNKLNKGIARANQYKIHPDGNHRFQSLTIKVFQSK
jgi:hypothetical protein